MIRNISDFYNNEYKQQAQNDNITKLAKVMDGFKFTGAKFFHTLQSLNDWIKVENLANKTADETEYPGGASNISKVIVNYSKSYVGSNNIPLAKTKGYFGSWLNPIPSAPRYIFVKKYIITEKIYRAEDLPILIPQEFEGKIIEPKFFVPIIPMLLVNGSKAIGTGHAQDIASRDVKDIIHAIKLKLNDVSYIFNATPYYNNFNGKITKTENPRQYKIECELIRINTTKLEIKEVPFTETYKSYIKKLNSLEDKGIIKKYDDLCDPKLDKFNFIIYCSREFTSNIDSTIKDILGLKTTITENYTIIDENLSVKVYDNINDVFSHYYKIRLEYYQKRKDYLLNKFEKDLNILRNKINFVKGVNSRVIEISTNSKKELENTLYTLGYDKVDDSYDYLLNMKIYALSLDKIEELENALNLKELEYTNYKLKDIKDIWIEEIDELLKALNIKSVPKREVKPKKEIVLKKEEIKEIINIKDLF